MTKDPREVAQTWLAHDPDPETQRELETLLARGDEASLADLADRFLAPLEFGTAGLRGVLGAGPNRMNRAVVLRACFGVGVSLAEAVADAKARGVAIGYDGRTNSQVFAEDSARVLTAMGFRVHLFSSVEPTPLLAFATKELGCAAGIMVTASHNPPEYNGYKVYWQNGAQIISPIDARIAEAIARAPGANLVPVKALEVARAEGLLTDVDARVEARYFEELARLVRPGVLRGEGGRDLAVVYTAMHGVGNRLALLALDRAGFTNVTTVPEQAEPDAKFPTVAFPNPEEKGAMDLAFALARSRKAALVLANDPDADRLAVAVPDASSLTGYVQFTGNQVGVLLGHYAITRHLAKSKDGASTSKTPIVMASIVSSPMLGIIATQNGVRYEEVLTGFKWIANRARELANETEFLFGYEEALGYTVGDIVRDKDGVSAALLCAELAAELRAEGKTLQDRLEELYRTHGVFVSTQINMTKKGEAGAREIATMMTRLRERAPTSLGGVAVERFADYAAQEVRVGGKREKMALPPSNVVAFSLAGGDRVIARPSGTEPKVKFYVDAREDVLAGESLAAATKRALAKADALGKELVALATGT